MLLAIDVGNTNMVIAVYDEDILIEQWRLTTTVSRTRDEYAVAIRQLFALDAIDISVIDAAILSTVVPATQFPLIQCMQDTFGCTPLVVGSPECDLGMEVRIDRPQEAGADRLVNAYAARARYGNSLLVLDFGTATTFDMVDADGAYAGGVIAPGINLSMEALHRAAAKLPNVAIVKPEKVLGTSTISAMQSGLYYGYIGLIEGLVDRLRAENGAALTVIATGGLAPLFDKATDRIDHLASDLTIEGLRLLYAHNQP